MIRAFFFATLSAAVGLVVPSSEAVAWANEDASLEAVPVQGATDAPPAETGTVTEAPAPAQESGGDGNSKASPALEIDPRFSSGSNVAAQILQSDLGQATAESLSKIRDPFQRPPVKTVEELAISDLERFPTEQWELLGVITGPKKVRAMLRSPDNKTYMISESMRIGTRKGVVKRITPGSIVVREKILNVFGREESVDQEIKLDKKREKSG